MSVLKLLCLIMLFTFASCKQEPTDFIVKNISVRAKRNMKAKSKCDSVRYKTVYLKLIHESLDSIALSKYRLVIDIDGVVYDGSYKRQIRIDNFELCRDIGYNVTSLIIYMIDEKNGIKYKWRNDGIYSFEKYSYFSIRLKYKHTPHAEDDLNSYYIDYN